MAFDGGCFPNIVLRMPSDPSQWGLIELQGQIETRNQVPLNGMHIGDLHFNSKGVPSLIVGHHLLTGKVQNLDKPFAILRKTDTNSQNDSALNDSTLHVDAGVHEIQDIEYQVVALITKKILFSNRPKPIITKTGIKKF